jgi:hypothetical protein
LLLEIEAGHGNDALAIAREVQKQRPKEAVGWLFEGDIQATAKNWASATALYRTALQKEATTSNAMKAACQSTVWRKASRRRSTRYSMIKAHRRMQHSSHTSASARSAEHQLAEAEAWLQQANELRPGNPRVLNNLAWTPQSSASRAPWNGPNALND